MKIIKFEQSNCNPCNLVSSYLEQEGVKYERVNAFDNPDLASEFGVMSVPVTVVLDDNSKEVFRTTGYKVDELSKVISLINN